MCPHRVQLNQLTDRSRISCKNFLAIHLAMIQLAASRLLQVVMIKQIHIAAPPRTGTPAHGRGNRLVVLLHGSVIARSVTTGPEKAERHSRPGRRIVVLIVMEAMDQLRPATTYRRGSSKLLLLPSLTAMEGIPATMVKLLTESRRLQQQ